MGIWILLRLAHGWPTAQPAWEVPHTFLSDPFPHSALLATAGKRRSLITKGDKVRLSHPPPSRTHPAERQQECRAWATNSEAEACPSA